MKKRIDPIPAILALVLLIAAVAIFPTAAEISDGETIRLPSDQSDICAVESDRQNSCPVTCFRPDPVCGADGVTYWCGCADALCAGVKVAKLGFCQVGNGGSAPLSAQALLLVHIVWLIVLGFSVLFGLF